MISPHFSEEVVYQMWVELEAVKLLTLETDAGI